MPIFRRLFPRRQRRDDGYAMLAAIAGLAVFGYIAFAMLAAERGGMAGTVAMGQQARLTAAADAGLVLAAAQVSARGFGAAPWRIDGRTYRQRFHGMTLIIRIEDERGKIRLNDLSDDQVRLMFESAGVDGRRLDALTDAFLDWRDEDGDARRFGAEAAGYGARGYVPRNGPLRSVAELALVQGMDRATYQRIADAATVFFGGAGAFDENTAQPLAIAVMTGKGLGSPAVIARQRALAGQRSALDLGADDSLIGRPLTVRVMVEDGDGGRMERATIIEFPGGPGRGWTIRYQR